MVTRIPQRKHILDQINKEIDILEKLVKALTGKVKAAEDEQGQINCFDQAQRQLTLHQFIK
jgi:outer membrane murein-binding lipoprotein Lpp